MQTNEGLLDPNNFAALLAYVQPKEHELRWLDIQWETDLWDARRLAISLNKPIFMWAMNGHPLGCV